MIAKLVIAASNHHGAIGKCHASWIPPAMPHRRNSREAPASAHFVGRPQAVPLAVAIVRGNVVAQRAVPASKILPSGRGACPAQNRSSDIETLVWEPVDRLRTRAS